MVLSGLWDERVWPRWLSVHCGAASMEQWGHAQERDRKWKLWSRQFVERLLGRELNVKRLHVVFELRHRARAPMMIDDTPGRASSHASATRATVVCSSAAMRAISSRIVYVLSSSRAAISCARPSFTVPAF